MTGEVTLRDLKLHAKRYGTEGVMQYAVSTGIDFANACDLQRHVDEIDSRKRRFQPKRRLSVETRVKRLLGIEEESEAK